MPESANIINYIDYVPMRSWDRQDFTESRQTRKEHQRSREDFCEFVRALFGAGTLFVGLYALTIICALFAQKKYSKRRGEEEMSRYNMDEIMACGIECEDGKQFEFRETASGEYIADEIVAFSDEEPEYYRDYDFDSLMYDITNDHGKYECLEYRGYAD